MDLITVWVLVGAIMLPTGPTPGFNKVYITDSEEKCILFKKKEEEQGKLQLGSGVCVAITYKKAGGA